MPKFIVNFSSRKIYVHSPLVTFEALSEKEVFFEEKKIEMSKIKLFYFDLRGRGELSRLIAACGNLDFEDVRLDAKDWPTLKQSRFRKSSS